MAPTAALLEQVTFLPFARQGVAAALTVPFSRAAPARPKISVGLAVTDATGSLPVSQPMLLRGPGDVLGFDPRQVIRVIPKAGRHDAEPNYLAHVELDRPDLPWLFTPTGPTGPEGQRRLYPWIVLVVVRADRVEVTTPGGGRLQVLSTALSELPNLEDSWAWAHAQVLGPPAEDKEKLATRLSETNPAVNLSRLVCPRRLEAHTDYRAFVVPAFKAGAEAGLHGESKTTDLSPSWGAQPQVEVPIYYEWRFGTGEDGDFEKLAGKLRARQAPPGLGVRRLDVTHPGSDVGPIPPDAPGGEELVQGPVVSPQRVPQATPWPAPEARAQLVAALNAADDAMKRQPAAGDPDPAVGPPLYGGNHVGTTRVDAQPPDPQVPWFEELNLDPRHRVVAGLGTRVVQMDQEELMASAWTQVAGVEATNRDLRLAQVSRYVGERLLVRHLGNLSHAALLSATHLVHSRVLDHPGATIRAVVESSATPRAVASPAMRRLLRDRGQVARFARPDARAAMVASPGGTTRDWVRQHLRPDGVGRLSARAAALAGDALGPTMAVELAERTSWPDLLVAGIDDVAFDPVGFIAGLADALVDRLLWTIPSIKLIEAEEFLEPELERQAAVLALNQAVLLEALHNVLLRHGVELVRVSSQHVDRLYLDVVGQEPPAVVVETRSLDRLIGEIVALVRALHSKTHPELNLDSDLRYVRRQEAEDELEQFLGEALHAEAGLPDAMRELAEPLVGPGGPTDVVRNTLDVDALGLRTKLHPARTVTARVRGRLGQLPDWVPKTWFDDERIEAVMAAPSFPFPMWEALDRYDRDWMVPGLGQLDTPDLVTVLETNSAFVEAFLVGLNHEMGRELLWRGYPTDQRGTCFRSFWTGEDELVDKLHRWRDGNLGSHVKKELDDKLVLLVRGEVVRRYPDLLASAQRVTARLGDGTPDFAQVLESRRCLFRAHLSPNILLIGFDLKEADAKVEASRWWFTLAEHPAGPRFGFDESEIPPPPPPRLPPAKVDDVSWDDLGTPPGGFLTPGPPPIMEFDGDLKWGSSAASNGAIMLQLPARVAIEASPMLVAVQSNGHV